MKTNFHYSDELSPGEKKEEKNIPLSDCENVRITMLTELRGFEVINVASN